MKSLIKLILTSLFLAMISERSYAQLTLFPARETKPNKLFFSLGAEPDVVATIGYLHLLGEPGKKVDFHLGASIKFAVLDLSNSAWRTNLTGVADWRISDKWGTRFIADLYDAHVNDRAAVMNGLGVEIRAMPVKYDKKWIKGFDLGWQYTVLTHIKHSAAAKETFNARYPNDENGIDGPRDGWYGSTASRFRLGVVGATPISDHLRFQIAFGGLLNAQKQGVLMGFSFAQFPFYLESAIAYAW